MPGEARSKQASLSRAARRSAFSRRSRSRKRRSGKRLSLPLIDTSPPPGVADGQKAARDVRSCFAKPETKKPTVDLDRTKTKGPKHHETYREPNCRSRVWNRARSRRGLRRKQCAAAQQPRHTSRRL